MTRKVVLLAAVCGLLLVSGCEKEEFKEFASGEGRFKVQMPGTPREETNFAAGTSFKTYSIQEMNGAYAVAFADMPIPSGERDAQIQARLDGARDGMVRNINATLTGSSFIRLNGKYPGREVRADLPGKKGILRARVYLVDRRLYQVMVVGTTSWANSPETTTFLDSLVVTP